MKTQISVAFVKKILKINMIKIKKILQSQRSCHTGDYGGVVPIICNLNYSIPKEVTMIFHNGSDDDYDFIVKKPAEESEGQLTWFRENTKKYIAFSVPVGKQVTTTDKN